MFLGESACAVAMRILTEAFDTKQTCDWDYILERSVRKGFLHSVQELLQHASFYNIDALDGVEDCSNTCKHCPFIHGGYGLLDAIQYGWSDVTLVYLSHLVSESYTPMTDFTRSIVERVPQALSLLSDYVKSEGNTYTRMLCRDHSNAREVMSAVYEPYSWRYASDCVEWHSPNGIDVFRNISQILGLTCRDTDFTRGTQTHNYIEKGRVIEHKSVESVTHNYFEMKTSEECEALFEGLFSGDESNFTWKDGYISCIIKLIEDGNGMDYFFKFIGEFSGIVSAFMG